MRAALRFAPALAIGCALLAGCAAAGTDQGGPAIEHLDRAQYAEADAPVAGTDYGGGADAPFEPAGDIENREVITTSEVQMVVEDPGEAADDVVRVVEQAQGRVDQRRVRGEQTRAEMPGGASLTVRVPAEELERFLEDLAALGEVEEITQSAQDVTQAAHDLDARIEALETSTDRLLEIMAEAEDSADLIAAEEALSRRQAELEALRSQRSHLTDQVAMATVHVHLTARDDPAVDPDGFVSGWQSGWHALLRFVSGFITVTGIALPWLLLLGFPALVGFWLIRRGIRTRRALRAPAHRPAHPAPEDPSSAASTGDPADRDGPSPS